jgi:hypothetical protein
MPNVPVSGHGTNELYSIAERVTALKALVAGDRNRVQNLNAALRQSCFPGPQVVYLIGKMSLGGSTIDIVFNSDVHLSVAYLKPESATPLQSWRLPNLREPQDAAVETSTLHLGTRRYRYLHVM